MALLELNLFRHPSEAAFDPCKVIQKAKAYFPEATFHPGDRAAAEVERAEAFLADKLRTDPSGPARRVIESLRRKARSYGPGFAFTIPLKEGGHVDGLARRVNVQFLFEEPIPEETRQRLIGFLKSLGIGYLQATTQERNQTEVLQDLGGPSDCLADLPEVPWKEELVAVPLVGPEHA